MIRWRQAAEELLPWAGWIGALLGWGAAQQVGSNTVFDHCAKADPGWIAVLGLAGFAVLAVGAGLSLRLRRRGGLETPTRRFLGSVGTLLSGVVAMALIWQTLAAFIIPQCYS